MKGVFNINMSGVTPTVELDGTTFTNIAEVRVGQQHGGFPQVVVIFDAHTVTVEGENGVFTVQKDMPGLTPAEFLKNINVDRLANEVLQTISYDQSPMAVFVERLKALANDD